jgi:hypothetical protein
MSRRSRNFVTHRCRVLCTSRRAFRGAGVPAGQEPERSTLSQFSKTPLPRSRYQLTAFPRGPRPRWRKAAERQHSDSLRRKSQVGHEQIQSRRATAQICPRKPRGPEQKQTAHPAPFCFWRQIGFVDSARRRWADPRALNLSRVATAQPRPRRQWSDSQSDGTAHRNHHWLPHIARRSITTERDPSHIGSRCVTVGCAVPR